MPKVMPFKPFDQSVEQPAIFIYACPVGHRAIIHITPTTGNLHLVAKDSTISATPTNFAPHIMPGMRKLWAALCEHHGPGITTAEMNMYRAGTIFDVILHDWASDAECPRTDNAVEMADFGEECAPGDVCVTVITAMPYAYFAKGVDKIDMGIRRSHLEVAFGESGLDSIVKYPDPTIRHMNPVEPNPWFAKRGRATGCRSVPAIWKQVTWLFMHGFKRALAVNHIGAWEVGSRSIQMISPAGLAKHIEDDEL